MPNEQKIPYKVAGYELIESLGHGGFGQVYRAKDKSPFQKQAAVKVVEPHPFSDSKHLHERFLREAEAVNKLAHSGIVKYYTSGFTEESGVPYLAMEFVEGNSLRDAALAQPFIGRVDLLSQVLDALEYAHSTGVYHRDIKPSNVMVRKSDGRSVIVDFGLAFLFEGISSQEFTTKYVGSVGYIPPEVLADFTHRAPTHDVYSCGITLYEILAGKRPNIQSYDSLSSVSLELAGIDPIIRKAIAPEKDRFKSAKEFSDALKSWLDIAVTRTKIGTNRIAELARKSMIKQRSEQEQRQAEKLQKQVKQTETWQEYSSIVYPAAKTAFEEMYAALGDLTEYDFNERSPGHSDLEPIFIYKHRSRALQIIFAQTKSLSEPMGAPSNRNNNLSLLGFRPLPQQPARGIGARSIQRHNQAVDFRQQPPGGVMLPAWVIYREGESSPKQIPHGAIAIALYPEPKLLARDIPKGKHGFMMRGGPIEVKTAEEVRDYVSRAIASIMGLDLEG